MPQRKSILIPDDILANYLDPEEVVAFKADGVNISSITVRGRKPEAACCVPNAEGSTKVKVATGETCGCGVDSTCC